MSSFEPDSPDWSLERPNNIRDGKGSPSGNRNVKVKHPSEGDRRTTRNGMREPLATAEPSSRLLSFIMAQSQSESESGLVRWLLVNLVYIFLSFNMSQCNF